MIVMIAMAMAMSIAVPFIKESVRQARIAMVALGLSRRAMLLKPNVFAIHDGMGGMRL